MDTEVKHVVEVAAAAGIGALVGAIVKPVGEWIRGIPRLIRQFLVPDHLAIQRTWFQNDQGGRDRIYVNIACGPSRRLGKSRRLDVDLVSDWAKRSFPGPLTLEPTFFDSESVIRFEKADSGGLDRAHLQIWSNGLIEITKPVAHVHLPDGRIVVALVDVAAVLMEFAWAIGAGRYERMYGRGILGRRRRIDWHISVSSALTLDGNWRPWDDLEFPKRQPRPKPVGMKPFVPTGGYGGYRLRNQSTGTKEEKVATIALTEMVTRAGYRDVSGPVSDVLASLHEILAGPPRDGIERQVSEVR